MNNEAFLQACLPFVQTAIKEDLGSGDHSSLSCFTYNDKCKAILKVKDEGIIAGIALAKAICSEIDQNIEVVTIKNDGDFVQKGDIAFILQGATLSILQAERLILNYMQRMSGIATKTKEYVSKIAHTSCRLLDTRKTTPNNRFAEKWAVKIGGGYNHRFGLYDMIMLKDNHIDSAGSITKAIQSAKKYINENKLDLQIEVETRNESQVIEAVQSGGINRIMFDNFTPEAIKAAIKQVPKYIETEASGGINLLTITQFAETGVDYVSVGDITHHINSLDLSLKIVD